MDRKPKAGTLYDVAISNKATTRDLRALWKGGGESSSSLLGKQKRNSRRPRAPKGAVKTISQDPAPLENKPPKDSGSLGPKKREQTADNEKPKTLK